jgi:iron complex transport system substrate-binding protein
MNRVWIALTISCCLALAVSAQSETAASQITIHDQAGYVVTFTPPVEAITSVHGIGTYYVYTLGYGELLTRAYYVGVKSVSSVPATMMRWEPRLSQLLSYGDPNVEEIVASGSDLVLADGTQHEAVAEQLRDLGIPVVLYRAETPDEMKEAITLTGTLLGADAERKAATFNADYDRLVDAVAVDLSALQEQDKMRILFVGTSLTKAISGEMYQSSLIASAGGMSVTDELFGSWNEVNLEQILLWNPQVIVIPPYGPIMPTDILENPDWQALDAVQSGRVYRMPRLVAPIDTPVPESLLGIAWMAKTFYPELVTFDLSQEVEHFYRDYYGLTLTDEEMDAFCNP